MNPIENLWGLVKNKVAEFQPKNIREIKGKILQAWNEISNDTYQYYALSFRKRALSLWRAHGKYTKYFILFYAVFLLHF